jgi:Family of unknown function (DUF6090)
MGDSKTKYFKYAIGEILLVVVGILIALSINNWNEQKKVRKFETRLLVELHNTVNDEIKRMDVRITKNTEYRTSAEIILNHLALKVPLNDSIAEHFENAFKVRDAQVMFSAFENIKSHGMNFIEDDEIRSLLLDTYDVQSQFLERLMIRYDMYNFNTVQPALTDNFKIFILPGKQYAQGFLPIDFNPKAEHHKIVNMLRKTSNLQTQILNTEWRINRMLEELDERLAVEIEAKR